MPAKPSILYVLPSLALGGTETHVLGLASGLTARGYKTSILTLFEEGALAEAAGRDGIAVECLHLPKRWGPSVSKAIARALGSGRPDIVHTYLFGFHLFAGLAARWRGVPVVLSSRRQIAHWKKCRHHLLERLGNLFADKVVCCSDAVRAWTMQKEGLGEKKAITLHNGLQDPRLRRTKNREQIRKDLGIERDAPVIGVVANLGVEKGHATLLEAFHRASMSFPNARLICVGDGPLLQAMREASADLAGVHWLGSRRDIPDLLEAMDVFVLPSEYEGLPNALLEAMAMERPVVATRVGGVPEIVAHPDLGSLVPAEDASAMSEAICALLKDRAHARSMGQAARASVLERFSFAAMLDRYEKLYRSPYVIASEAKQSGKSKDRIASPPRGSQ